MNIAIIGAGISGLTAAYELSKKGHEVVVFERSDTPGGLGTYIKVKENYLERYYHHFFLSDKYIRKLTKELKLENKLKFYRAKTGIYSESKIYPFSAPVDLLNFEPLSLLDKIRCGLTLGFLKILPKPPKNFDNISAADWIKRYAGKNVYNKIWGPLLDGKFSEYSSDVPLIWFWGRIKDRSVKLGYFDGSVKIMFDKLTQEIEKHGGKIKLNSEISGIIPKKTSVIIEEGTKRHIFDKVVITSVSPIAEKLIKEGLSKQFRKYLSSLDHLGAVCLILELKHKIQSQYWLNVCERNAPVLVMVEHTNMIPSRFYGGRTLVYLANYIHRNNPRFKISDEEVVREYSSILRKLNPDFKKSWILKSYVSRVPRAQSIFYPGSLQNRPPTKLPVNNVYIVNIDQMYPHDRNLNQGVELGKKVAEMINSEK